MVEADSTINVESAGLIIFGDYQKNNCETLIYDITEDYLEGVNIKVILTYCRDWISTTAITKFL